MIIAKYLVKNILEKPLRTLLLVLCMCCCVFVALFGLDILSSLDGILRAMLGQVTGSTDIIVSDEVGVAAPYELSYECRQLLIRQTSGGDIVFADGQYSYFHKQPFSIKSMDYELAAGMRLFPGEVEIADDEAVISPLMARKNGYQEGDSLTLYDEAKHAHTYKITKVLPSAGLANGSASVFLSRQGFDAICSETRVNLIYIDVADDAQAGAVTAELKERYFNASAENILDQKGMSEELDSLKIAFAMLFLICFLIVIFVSVSVSGRIVCERMAVVGTFRSLGLSQAFTTKLLLLENASYGLLGGIAGTALYLAAREPIYLSVVQVSSGGDVSFAVSVPPISVLNCLLVILMAAAVMMACPLKAILSSSKMAIRDIIFDNKDTAYRMGKYTTAAGVVCAALAVMSFLLKNIVVFQMLCFCLLIIALALLFPHILKLLSTLFDRLFETWNLPVARLAALEIYARKSTVGSSVLCVTASALAITLLILIGSLDAAYDIEPYQGDVIVRPAQLKEPEYFSYIKDLEGVEKTEMISCTSEKISFHGKQKELTVFALPENGFELFAGIKDYPEVIADDEFVLDAGLAKKLGLYVGEEVKLCLKADTFLPMEKTLRLAAVADGYGYDTTGDVMLLSQPMYESIYHDYPGIIIVKCEQPERVALQIEEYSSFMVEQVRTAEEEKDEWMLKKSSLRGMLTAVICFGVGLTLIGMISNQLIGFEGRKRECAVLTSVAMPREALAKMFLIESALAALAALLVALPSALITFIPLKRILYYVSGSFPIRYHILLYLLFEVVLWIVFTLGALFPIHKLRKMEIAAQLKYE